MLKLIIAILTVILPASHPSQVQVGKATTFHPVDNGLNNGILGCTGAKWKNQDMPYCASRQHKLCGKWVLVENLRTKDRAWCKVMDLGPYGKLDSSGKWFNAALERKRARAEGREQRKGTYKGILDMSQSVSSSLHSKGRILVKVTWWKNNPLDSLLDYLLLR